MSVRISREQSLRTARAGSALDVLRREQARAQEALATGRRVNRPSDDPAAFAQARSMEALEQRYAQHTRTLGDARLWVNRTEAELAGLAERFTEAYEEGLRALNDTLSPEDRATIADRAEALLAEVVDGLNATSGGEYLFAGTRTTTAPFATDGTPTGDLSGARRRTIGPGVELQINVSGDHVHDTGEGFTVTESLQTMIDALRGTGDVALGDALERVTVARDHLVDLGAETGSTARRLTQAELQLQEASTEAARRRSELEDADYLEVVTRLQRTQTALEAALKTTATTLQTTLLDYLR